MTGFEFLADHTTQVLIIAAFIGMALDFASGFANAAMKHEISSEKMRLGLWHKISFAGAILLGVYVQWVMSISDISLYLGFSVPATSVICIIICAIEVTSIYENLKKINPDIPQIFKGEQK